MIVPEALLAVLVDVSDTLVDDYDLVEFLDRLASHVAEMTQAASVGLVLADRHRKLRFMAASTEDAKHIELLQLQASEGPSTDCFHSGVPVIVDDLGTVVDRWPGFAPKALQRGIRSTHAFPMRLRGQVIGTLNVFNLDVRPQDPEDVRIIQAMADIATIGILQQRAVSTAATLGSQLQGALDSRVLIEQAKGVLSQTFDVDVDTAFQLLRLTARRNQQPLTQLAASVVKRQVDVSTWRI